MKLIRLLLLTAAVACIPLAASAQTNVIFTNDDGTFVYDNTTQELTLGSVNYASGSIGAASQLTAISGLSSFGISDQAVAFPTCEPTCLGSLTLTTATLASGSILSNATFNPGGTITVNYSGLASGTVTFSGTFSTASWTMNPGGNSWTFSGTITNGTLMINGSDIPIPTAVTVQLTLTGSGATFHKTKNAYTFSDGQGSTNFSVAPEPGTLALFGSGLIAIGFITRRKFGAKAQGSSN